MKKSIVPVLLLSITLSAVSPVKDIQAATNLTLSKSKVTLTSGTSTTVKANKSVKWKSSNPKIATVKKLSTKKAKIYAKKVGTCKITATYKKKKKTIRVTVKKPSNTQITATKTPNPQVSITPTVQPEAVSTYQPVTVPTQQPVAVSTYQPEIPSVTNPVSTTTPNNPEQIGQISTKLINIDSQKVTFSITNESGYEAMFGYDFALEKSENGQWVPVEPTTPIDFPAVAISLLNGKTYQDSISLKDYAPLDSGAYRIVKVFYVNAPIQDGTNKTPSVTTYTEFTLKESITQQPVTTKTPTPQVSTNPTRQPATVSTNQPVTTPSTPSTAVVPATQVPSVTNPVSTATPSNPEQIGQISTKLINIDNQKVTFSITNESGYEAMFGHDFALEKSENGQWVPVEPTTPIYFPEVLISLLNGETYQDSISLKDYAPLEYGTYRIVKVIYVNAPIQDGTNKTPRVTTYTEFTLNPSIVEPPVTTAPVITTPSSVVSSGGVSAIIEGYKNGKLTYVLTNNLDHGHNICWKDILRIQKEVNGEWKDVEQVRFENKMTEEHSLSYGKSQTYTENIATYFDLEPGNYRMHRRFYADACKCCVELDLPFEVKDNYPNK